MPIDFYHALGSPPCCAVMLTAKALGVEVNIKKIDFETKDYLKPEFVKINPQHTVPTIVDDGFALAESRAIQVYLVTKYGKDDTLYPNDAKKRGIVEHRLNFDLGTLYQRLMDVYYPAMLFGASTIAKEKIPKLTEALEILDIYLSQTKWAAGDHITVADHSLVASLGAIDAVNFDLTPYKNVTRWYNQCQEKMPGYKEINQHSVDVFRQWATTALAGKM